MRDLERELDAQIAKARELAGGRLTHLDSQGNTHLLYLPLFTSLAKKWRIDRARTNASLICLEADHPVLSRLSPTRDIPRCLWDTITVGHQMRVLRSHGLRMADRLITIGHTGLSKTSIDIWINVLRNLPPGTFEIYCHPAFLDATIHKWSYYTSQREEELKVLSSPRLRQIAADYGIELISFYAI